MGRSLKEALWAFATMVMLATIFSVLIFATTGCSMHLKGEYDAATVWSPDYETEEGSEKVKRTNK